MELTGYGGVGKTTLYERVVQNLADAGVPCNERGPARSLSARVVGRVATRLELLESYRLIAKARPTNWTHLKRYARRFSSLQLQYRRATHGSGIYLFHEGVFQLLVGLFVCSRQPDMLRASELLLNRLPLPHLVVLIEATVDAVQRRRSVRARPGENVILDVEEKEAIAALWSTVQHWATQTDAMRFVTIRNELVDAPDEVAGRITTAILAHYSDADGT